MATVKGGSGFEAALGQLAEGMKAGKVRVGFLEGATYPDGKKVAEVAALNEYGHTVKKGAEEGSYFVLPRPFFRRMIADKQSGWGSAAVKALKKTGNNTEKALGLIGTGIGGQLQQSIRDLVSPPLAPSTVARKGFDKPLIDTGHMLNSVDHETVME